MSATLQYLTERFNGALLVRPVEAGKVIDLSKQSTYNRCCAGTFPLPLVETAAGRRVRVTDLANYLDSLETIQPQPQPKPATQEARGRPTKAEQVEAQRRGITVPELRAQISLGV